MPLTADDVQPGDIIICYGWNKVALSQGLAKTLNRVTVGAVKTVRDILAVPANAAYHGHRPRCPVVLELGDPVGIGRGSASANHALIVGPSEYVERRFPVMETAEELAARQRGALDHARRLEEQQERHEREQGTWGSEAAERIAASRRKREAQAWNLTAQMTTKKRQVQMPSVCHSTGDGFLRQSIDLYLKDHGGSLAVFRMQADGNDFEYAIYAGAVARRWAAINRDDNEVGESSYSSLKAFMSALGSSAFGPGASNRAALYRRHKDTYGGPPADRERPGHTHKGFFCSMFVLACYQAASPDDAYCRKYLALDAKYTTPMTLDGYLRSNRNRWRLVGTLP